MGLTTERGKLHVRKLHVERRRAAAVPPLPRNNLPAGGEKPCSLPELRAPARRVQVEIRPQIVDRP